ncbi:hypothetical protein GIB67_003520 [Kingdonia uniflora]|uniref:Stress-induced protein KIN2-like n=1 Tax=Kingdonia uniflora TaxID=39325 RepID=A0A7J7MEU2_9MAGN|nr:hypothetical protein GIB67_003520 [Kingdonia uniflora]
MHSPSNTINPSWFACFYNISVSEVALCSNPKTFKESKERNNNNKYIMADNTQSMSMNAGEAKGQAEVKKDQMMDKASGAAQSAKESCQETGAQMKAKAEGAADTIKEATGMKK